MEPLEGDGIPRTVKPRKDDSKWLPLIVIGKDEVLLERTGELHPRLTLRDLIIRERPSIVIAQGVAEMVASLTQEFARSEDWQYRVTPTRREIHRPGARRNPVVVDTLVNYFGFRGELRASGKSRKPGRWFYPVDPFVFVRVGLSAMHTGTCPEIVHMLTWGIDLRAFCAANGLTITPTGGGLAGQLLRDPRFYPQARRKVPRKTNAAIRDHLPGNFYRLYVNPDVVIPRAVYLDMASAHHHVAARTTFPHADRLMRRGDWDSTDPTDTTVPHGRPQWEPGTRGFTELLLGSHGLLRMRLRVPAVPDGFPLPCMEREGVRSAYVYTNEIPYLLSMGCSIEGIDAAWTAFQRDHGLNRYARWALSEIEAMPPERKRWAKPVLLSAYGILAAKPKLMEMGHRISKSGRIVELPAGKLTLSAHMKRLGIREVPVANVVQRGMIEAGTRLASIQLARAMRAEGRRVLSIYADAVFLEDNGPMPFLSHPWTVKAYLTNLIFHNPTSFTSAEVSKLPGIPREGMERARRLAVLREAKRRRIDSVRQSS